MKQNYSRSSGPLRKIARLLVGILVLLAVHVALLNNLLNYNKPTVTEPGEKSKRPQQYQVTDKREAVTTLLYRQTEMADHKKSQPKDNPSVQNVDYGQGRWLEIEGLEDYFMWHENYFEPQAGNTILRRLQKYKRPVTNVFFLKTHCTGGEILVNILNRFADLRNLLPAVPTNGLSTFHWPNRFNWNFIDLMLLNGQLPNIYTSHTRFNSEVINRILPADAAIVTILRNPVDNFAETFKHFEYARILRLENYTDPLLSFLENPKLHIQAVVKERRFMEKMNLIINGMFFDLGLKTANYHKPAVVRDAISDIEDEFTLVLIYEYLDESLVLLKRKLCWELDDILYINHFNEYTKTQEENLIKAEKIKEWSAADTSLYQYFNKSLWDQIAKEGEDFHRELAQFKLKQREIRKDCVGYFEDRVSDSVYKVTLNSNVSAMNRYLCEKLLFSEMDYLEYFRNKMKRTLRSKINQNKSKAEFRTTVRLNSSLIAGSARGSEK